MFLKSEIKAEAVEIEVDPWTTANLKEECLRRSKVEVEVDQGGMKPVILEVLSGIPDGYTMEVQLNKVRRKPKRLTIKTRKRIGKGTEVPASAGKQPSDRGFCFRRHQLKCNALKTEALC